MQVFLFFEKLFDELPFTVGGFQCLLTHILHGNRGDMKALGSLEIGKSPSHMISRLKKLFRLFGGVFSSGLLRIIGQVYQTSTETT